MSNAKLFDPVRLKGVTARNPIVVSPMCQYQSVGGSPTDWHFVHMGRYAVGGAGIVFYEETAVEARGRKTPLCAALFDDGQIPAYKRIADLVRSLGAVPAMQLGHSGGRASERGPLDGRKPLTEKDAELGWQPWEPISSSAVQLRKGSPVPRAMELKEIQAVVQAFADAAVRSLRAGFEIVEIHGAHGYLIQQFLSPLVNRRKDAYGGSLNGRMRFALEISEAVRAVWPADKPLFFRISVLDGKGGLWSLDDSIELAKALKTRGVDLIDCSSGGLSGDSTMPEVPRVPSYHVPYARRIKQATGLPTMAPGFITGARQAEDLLRQGDVDLIGMARELMFHSDWPVHAARELGVEDYLRLFPAEFVPRLQAREEQTRMPKNQPGAPIPSGVSGYL
ncbi:NADH:flavin oxidoreductase/NADH oxidase [Pigmentiphaga soli]|uniref:NADH:flavin oxidoreductase/NADH oxidase n=1 Tax=Pigmentiphaga soli TaxID=1007095 RepID=A0ABP8H2J5_9BURK